MNVFVTGASGWIGTAVVAELQRTGHEVLGLARSEASATRLRAAGAFVHRGDLADPEGLATAAATCDGVIHLAFIHDFEHFDASVRADARAVDALGVALEGSNKPLVIASGTPAVPGRVATERDDLTGGLAGARGAVARATVALAERGVRSSVVRLPRTVHGRGDLGFVARLIDIARATGVSGYVGDGSSRWPAVHVLDAARLFRLALEHAPAGAVLHAVADEDVATRDIAETIGRRLGVPTTSVPVEQFGFLGAILAVDQPASSEATRELMDWNPTEPRLLEDLSENYYYTSTPLA